MMMAAGVESAGMKSATPATMPLRELLRGLAQVPAGDDRAIAGLSLDSRRVARGDLFCAVPGETRDGRAFIAQAVANGAAAVARESGGDFADGGGSPGENLGVPNFAVANLSDHLGAIAARFFGQPSARMRVIGITGTNGKTTCAYLIAQALQLLGQRCALLGTLGAGFIGGLRPAPLTTADAIATQRALADLLARGAQAVCVEASSHGLAQGRVGGVDFDIALFTNLSRDHLDYHGGMSDYRAAKRKLFEVDDLRCAVVNADDEFGRALARRHRAANCLTYGIHDGGAEVRGRAVAASENGLALSVEYNGEAAMIRSPLLGAINAPNLLAAVAALLCCGYELGAIAATAEQWRAPPGRMELIRGRQSQPAVVVDYAHTPDALARALESLAELCQGKLCVVFGAGGERDRGKRAQMGRVAENIADRVIVTDDNPRGESPAQIAAHIAAGMRAAPTIIHDRRLAIETAVAEAAPCDIVLIAGKGHETTQTIGGQVNQFSDRAAAEAALAEAAK